MALRTSTPILWLSRTALVLALALSTMLPPASAADNCGAQFNEKNAPDNATCTFGCEATQQLVISIDASDGDATASGSARCGGGYSPCRPSSGTNSCYGEEGYANSGSSSGSCAAVVDEWWNSAWSYNCLARDVNQPCAPAACGGGGSEPGDCYFNLICCPAILCGADSSLSVLPKADPCADAPLRMATPDLDAPEDPEWPAVKPPEPCASDVSAAAVRDPLSGLPSGVTSRVDVWVRGHETIGRVCQAGVGCWTIVPNCTIDPIAGRVACIVTSAAKVLGRTSPLGA